MSNPWALTDDQKHTLVLAGFTADGLTALETKREETFNALREALYGEDQAAADRHFYEKYGFEHTCTCVNDKFLGNTRDDVPVCTLEMGDKALEHLTTVLQERDALVEQVMDLRTQVTELGAEPRA